MVIQEILKAKVALIDRYINLNSFPLEFVWNEDEYSLLPFKQPIIDHLKAKTIFKFTDYGIIIYDKRRTN